jgi:hypothetical protein
MRVEGDAPRRGTLFRRTEAHRFVRGLTVCHLDATLRQEEEARRLLSGDLEAELAVRGMSVLAV